MTSSAVLGMSSGPCLPTGALTIIKVFLLSALKVLARAPRHSLDSMHLDLITHHVSADLGRLGITNISSVYIIISCSLLCFIEFLIMSSIVLALWAKWALHGWLQWPRECRRVPVIKHW